MKNRPLLLPALCFASGILGEDWWRFGPWWWLSAAVAALASAVMPWRVAPWGLWTGWLLAGGLAYAIHRTPVSPMDLRRLSGGEPQLVMLRGALSEAPSLRLREQRGRWIHRTLVRMEVEAWRPDRGDWAPATGSVMTATRGEFPDTLFRGSVVQVTGVLEEPRLPQAPGLFDYRRHLEHQDIFRVLDVSGIDDWQWSTNAAAQRPWSERFLPWARSALAHGLPEDESTRLLWAMALGWRTALSGEVDTAFMESGTMHVFAISGLHIALIAALLLALLRAVRVPRPAGVIVVIPLLWFYVAATGWQPSAERSALMMSVVAGTWVLKRPGDLLNSLGLAALVLLVREPGQLMQAGFQLSFGVVAGLALLSPGLGGWMFPHLRFPDDPFLPEALRPHWQRWLEAPIRHLASGVVTGVAAFLSSLPVTTSLFHLFSPVSILANLLIVPLSSLALASCAASLLTFPLWPGLAAVFNASAWLWMHLMVVLSRAFAGLPGGVWYVATPPPMVWIPYGGLLLLLVGGEAVPSVCRRLGRLRMGLALVAAGVVAVWLPWWRGAQGVRLTCLPGGDALVVDAPGRRRDLVVNTGGVRSGPGLVTPFLRAQGWNSVPGLLLAQADAARLGDGTNFVRRFHPNLLAAPGRRQRSPAYRSALAAADILGIPVREVAAGDLLYGWTVLNPPSGGPVRSADEASVALLGTWGGIRVLLLPNLNRRAQRALLDRSDGPAALQADVVVAGIPRSDEPLIPELLQTVRPQLIVMTTAAAPATARARSSLRERLEASGVPAYYTEDGGALEMELQAGGAVLRRGPVVLHRVSRPGGGSAAW